jgi:hypothetical protein
VLRELMTAYLIDVVFEFLRYGLRMFCILLGDDG